MSSEIANYQALPVDDRNARLTYHQPIENSNFEISIGAGYSNKCQSCGLTNKETMTCDITGMSLEESAAMFPNCALCSPSDVTTYCCSSVTPVDEQQYDPHSYYADISCRNELLCKILSSRGEC